MYWYHSIVYYIRGPIMYTMYFVSLWLITTLFPHSFPHYFPQGVTSYMHNQFGFLSYYTLHLKLHFPLPHCISYIITIICHPRHHTALVQIYTHVLPLPAPHGSH